MNPGRRDRIITLGFRLIVLALAAIWIAFPPKHAQPLEAAMHATVLVSR